MSIRDILLPNAHDLYMQEVNARVKADGCGGSFEWAAKHPGKHLFATFRTKVNATMLCKFCCAIGGSTYRCPGPWELRGRGESS